MLKTYLVPASLLAIAIAFFIGFFFLNGFTTKRDPVDFNSQVLNVLDATGQIVQLRKPAQRVISLAPDTTELLFAIGAGDKIVGVLDGHLYPKAAEKITKVGSFSGLDLEKIIALKPDLIVTWHYGFARQMNALKRLNIPVYETAPKHLADIAKTAEDLGKLIGAETKGKKFAQVFTQKIDAIRKTYQGKQLIRVFYQIGSGPPLTINKESWINDVIELCGGRNSFASLPTLVPELDLEAIIQKNPQVMITDSAPGWDARWLKWTMIDAIQHHRLFLIPADFIDRAGPRLLQGIVIMCRCIDAGRESGKKIKGSFNP